MAEDAKYPSTPDGRYFVVRGRLWRKSNPHLDASVRQQLVQVLMDARRAMRGRGQAVEVRAGLRAVVDRTKRALGERGPAWWNDGAPDFNQRLVKNTPYAAWFDGLTKDGKAVEP